ncbi:MAG: RNA-guided endonuclease InsQ/TnpB family protein [Candidatus Hodarchaeales archaeon]
MMRSITESLTSVNRVETIYYKPDAEISNWCHLAKNLWNKANYIVRQEFINEGNWIRFRELRTTLQDDEDDYRKLPIISSQEILRLLDKAWLSFFRSIKEWKKHPDKYLGRPKLPGYKKKDGEMVLPFSNTQVRFRNGVIKLPNMIGLEVKTRLKEGTNIKGARIVPQGVGYNLEIIYEKEISEMIDKTERIAGLDLGVNNLATIATNIGVEPIVVKGGPVKSMNQFYNKRKSELQSIYDKQEVKDGSKMKKLSLKRKHKLKDFFHKASRKIIDWCIKNRIDTLVVGRNDGWKQKSNMGRVNNQKFVSVPFDILRNQLAYKGEEVEILVIDQEESYTSKCSFLDMEPLEHQKKYVGRRIKRGMFRASDGTRINSDVNGAYNIIRKAIPNAFVDGIEGLWVAPRRLSV